MSTPIQSSSLTGMTVTSSSVFGYHKFNEYDLIFVETTDARKIVEVHVFHLMQHQSVLKEKFKKYYITDVVKNRLKGSSSDFTLGYGTNENRNMEIYDGRLVFSTSLN